MTLIRWLLGRFILSLEFIMRPQPLLREEEAQKQIDYTTSELSLYQFNACPFCVKVRHHIRKYSLNIEVKDAKNNIRYKEELIIGGGAHKVPCLRIDHSTRDTEWLYESDEIIAYLKKNFLLS